MVVDFVSSYHPSMSDLPLGAVTLAERLAKHTKELLKGTLAVVELARESEHRGSIPCRDGDYT
jgi:hypothetical protein